MTDIAVIGAGPAGLRVVENLLAAEPGCVVWWIERQPLPDGQLRHGPAAGAARLRSIARRVDTALADPRVRFVGGAEVLAPQLDKAGEASVDLGQGLFPTRGLAVFRPRRIAYDLLRSAFSAVVIATGASTDRPLDVAGDDSVGIGTVSHLRAWLAGSPDVAAEELDLSVDSAVFVRDTAPCRELAEVLTCRSVPTDVPPVIRERLAASTLRSVSLVPEGGRVIGVVGRNRPRALRIICGRDRDGLVRIEDIRAQLLLRPVAGPRLLPGVDADGAIYRSVEGRASQAGVYVAGWAGRDPADPSGSHESDADAVIAALIEDLDRLPDPSQSPENLVRWTASLRWSAVEAIDELLRRFSGDGTVPFADYDDLLEQVGDD